MKASTAFLFVMLLIGTTAAEAQSAQKVRVIGYLGPGGGPGFAAVILGRGLRDLGWIDGTNVRIEYRWADSKPERLAPLAEELVSLKVELIIASSTAAVQAAKNATTTIPIIMGPAADAEGSGFVASLARPGGNITGVSMMMPALQGKLLELLREITPSLSRVAYLAYASDPGHKMFLKQTQEAGQALKIGVQAVVVSSAAEFEQAFAAMKAGRTDALIVHPTFSGQLGLGPRIAELAKKNRLPAISDGSGFAEAGGLLYYGSAAYDVSRIAGYVDRILKGAKPADMPVEQPQKFQLLVNMNTAKQLGLKVPQSLLLRADRVIE